VAALKVGNGFEAGVGQGPLIDAKALAGTEAFVADARAKGGRILTGGEPHPLGGTFYRPTVIADATAEMAFTRDEIFGPVAPLYRFETEDEAVALANSSEYGLAGYCYTRDLSRAFRMAERLKFGQIGINEGVITTEVAPFGGVKASGSGREGSKYGLDDYLDVKYVCIGI
jgi:succinate-semialdehyde dehydrogenase/glutarate-semialdehyde dehydrogenase